VFAVNIDGTEFRTLHAFDGVTDSGHPFGALVLSNNMLYGVTQEGISPDGLGSDNGTVFAVSTEGSGFTTLYSFFNGGADGWAPYAGLVQSGNSVYGSVALGGSAQHGNLYALNKDGTSFTVLYSFSGPDGILPMGDLLLVGNTLYGVTEEGGTDGTPGGGTIFSINTDATAFRTIYSFGSLSSAPNATNSSGAAPLGGLLLLKDTLYGTASFGGTSGNGTVFKLNVDGTGFTVLHNFTATTGSPGTNNDGAHPGSSLTLVSNILYGTTANGGSSGLGTIFSITLPGSPPRLTINRSVNNLTLAWPTNAAGFQLESATDWSANTAWQTVTNPIVTVGDLNTVTVEIGGNPEFFRLREQ
jgi:uncharacterized repeat protein (TIGR03803 family)